MGTGLATWWQDGDGLGSAHPETSHEACAHVRGDRSHADRAPGPGHRSGARGPGPVVQDRERRRPSRGRLPAGRHGGSAPRGRAHPRRTGARRQHSQGHGVLRLLGRDAGGLRAGRRHLQPPLLRRRGASRGRPGRGGRGGLGAERSRRARDRLRPARALGLLRWRALPQPGPSRRRPRPARPRRLLRGPRPPRDANRARPARSPTGTASRSRPPTTWRAGEPCRPCSWPAPASTIRP